MKVLILAPAPLSISPSQRFRYEHYINDPAIPSDLHFEHRSFFSYKAWAILFKKGYLLKKTAGVIAGLIRNLFILFTLNKYDAVYVHRGITPIGPPVFEWMIVRLFRKNLIFDFDDAIWVRSASVANPLVAGLKWHSKVKRICGYSTIVSVGNAYLAEFAKKYCNDVRIIPTVVDTEKYHNQTKIHGSEKVVIGWTGTFTNFGNLELILPVIRRLQEKYDFTFKIIADKDPGYTDLQYEYSPWKYETEIEDLLTFSIGIMPLKNEEMENGKCAFKAIQYMSLGIPAVVSPVGANISLVQDGINGYLADSYEDWEALLEKLMMSPDLRNKIGAEARKHIEQEYSVKATLLPFCNLFKA